MAFVQLNNEFPGIEGLLLNKPSTGKAICRFVQQVLRGSSSLTFAEREIIAAYVSHLNNCMYCSNTHTEVANALLNDEGNTMACVNSNMYAASLSSKMKALLQIAAKVQQGGMYVGETDIENARKHGAKDNDIHNAVLVAAMFCFVNRYVDGLRTEAPPDKNDYKLPAKYLARSGYHYPNFIGKYFMKRMFQKQKTKKKTTDLSV
jgi:uncharacterized peroxidase-related enzyme